ncbi:TOM (translocase of outer membrane) complex component [Mactra antiquata]
MAFAAGAAVLNSCNKARAVDHFTRHLATNPDDCKALRWRSQAYSILGQNQNAVKDIDRAINVGQGVQRKLAMAEKKLITCSDVSECLGALKQVTDEHPDCWEAYYKYGALQRRAGNTEGAIRSLRTAVDIAGEKRELKDPSVCWINLELGLLWSNKGEIDVAISYFKDAIQSSPTHTISYINLCKENLRQGNLTEAKQNFETANGLNPTLVKQIFEVDTFDAFLVNLKQKTRSSESELEKDFNNKMYVSSQADNGQAVRYQDFSHKYSAQLGQQRATSAGSDRHRGVYTPSTLLDNYEVEPVLGHKSKGWKLSKPVAGKTKEKKNYSSGAAGSGGGRGGGGSGSGSDDDEDNPFSGMDVSQIWKKLQKESPNIKMYGKHKYVQSKCGQYWYSKDTAGHGGAAFKRYDNSRSYLSFRDSLDAKMRPMIAKHESRENTMIFKSDMVGVRGN